ncbi:MAG: hypothetical protein SGARI_006423 [Bacillariaceae sp.]
MSKPRPGVQAGKRLFDCDDVKVWKRVERQHDADILDQVKTLREVHRQYQDLGDKLQSDDDTNKNSCITKEELLLVVKWKFLVGKPRYALMKHLLSNTEKDVNAHSAATFEIAKTLPDGTTKISDGKQTETIKKALEALTNLKGVGPATASAVLALVRPDVFGYMYDESIESVGLKRAYNVKTYLELNARCMEIVTTRLGSDWTPSRVSKTLWAASRANAYGLEDHTAASAASSEKKRQSSGKENAMATKKRQRVAKA